MTTVGYGDLIVTTTLERAFCVLGMVIGATVFGYIVGNVSVMMESFDLQSALQTQKMDRVKVNVQFLAVRGGNGVVKVYIVFVCIRAGAGRGRQGEEGAVWVGRAFKKENQK